MSTNIKLKRSSVAGKQPNTSILELGEVAINTHDGKLFFKKDDGVEESIVTLLEVTEDNLAIDSANLTNATANNLSGVLFDLDEAITTLSGGGLSQVTSDSTLNGLGTAGSPLSVVDNGHTHYANTILDFDTTVNTSIYATVDKTFIDALNVDASTLEGANGTFYLDYNNFNNTPTIGDGTITFSGDSVIIPSGSFDLNDTGNTEITLTVNTAAISITESQISDFGTYLPTADFTATANTWLATRSTTNLSEGTNLYYTLARANTAIDDRVTKGFVDALAVDADTLDAQQGSYYLNYNNFTNTPTLYTTADANNDIDARVTKSFVDALNVDANTLDGANSDFFLDYTNFTNTPSIPVSGVDFDPVGTDNSTDVTLAGTYNYLTITGQQITLNQIDYSTDISNLPTLYTTANANTDIDARVTKTFVDNLNVDADTLDSQDGTYYLDWTNTTNKPDPNIEVVLSGDVTGSANTTLTNLANGQISITTTVADDSHNHIVSNVDGLQTALDGKVDKSGSTMTGFLTLHAEPTQALHAATKAYVDEIAEGLKVAPAVELATTSNLTATYDNGNNGIGATLTATTNGAFPEIDGVTVSTTELGENGILVRAQANTAHNGRYNLTTVGDGSNPWVLTKCFLCDEANEIPGSYVFVKDGTLYGGTGWVALVDDPTTFTVGTDAINYVQFSGAGTYTAGTDLTLDGTTFNLNATISANTTGTANNATNLNGQAASYYLDYNNFTNTPSIPQSGVDFDPVGTDNSTDVTLAGSYDYLTLSGQQITLNQIDYDTDISNKPTLYTTADANTDIDARVTKSFVDALNVDADTLDGANSTFYLDYTNFINTPTLYTTADANNAIDARVTKSFVDALNVDADTLDGNDSTYFTNASNLASGTVPTARLGTGTANSTTYLAGDQTWKEITSGGGTTWSVKTANYTAVTGDGIVADTSGGTFTITLPASPSAGDNVILADGDDWGETNLTVARNGSTIEGAAEDLTLDVGSIQVHLIYSGTTWEVYAFTGPGVSVQADDNTTNATKYITWADAAEGGYEPKVSSTKLYFNPSTGTLNATDFNSLSDQRLKENVQDLAVDYDMLNSIRSVSFDWKDNGKSAYGFIAQELEEVMPELVATNEDSTYKSVSYVQLIPHLLEAIKDLKKQVDELKEKN